MRKERYFNMEENRIRLLRAEEIECRVAKVNQKGVSLLLYKDARVDCKILDEVFGPMNWQRTHQSIDGNLYCTVSIWDPEKSQWISKQDVGTRSYTEQEKGQASDSFKRAAVVVGIGRELYTAPFIWIPAERVCIERREGGPGGDRYVVKDTFRLRSISYNRDREIAALEIVNGKDVPVFQWTEGSGTTKTASLYCPALNERELWLLEQELARTGVELGTVLNRYGLQDAERMTPEIYRKIMSGLKRSKDRAA